eukprot:366450-Chlamydomonas_euryale.AAC.27
MPISTAYSGTNTASSTYGYTCKAPALQGWQNVLGRYRPSVAGLRLCCKGSAWCGSTSLVVARLQLLNSCTCKRLAHVPSKHSFNLIPLFATAATCSCGYMHGYTQLRYGCLAGVACPTTASSHVCFKCGVNLSHVKRNCWADLLGCSSVAAAGSWCGHEMPWSHWACMASAGSWYGHEMPWSHWACMASARTRRVFVMSSRRPKTKWAAEIAKAVIMPSCAA